MKLSINTAIIDKNANNVNQGINFTPADLTPKQLAEHVSRGYAYSAQVKDGKRKKQNFICSDVVTADIDEGMTWDEAMNDEFIKSNACLVYTTVSHTEESHRLRLVFQLPKTIDERTTFERVVDGLIRKYAMAADPKARDAARLFYGSRNCQYKVFDQAMSNEAFDQLMTLGEQPLNRTDRKGYANEGMDIQSHAATSRSIRVIKRDTLIRKKDDTWDVIDNLTPGVQVYCPGHNDKKPSVFVVTSRTGQQGIRCSRCQSTYWPDSAHLEPYDFFHFDNVVKKAFDEWTPTAEEDERGLVFGAEPRRDLVINEKYLPDLVSLKGTGVSLIKSPKGTGKTQYLKRLVRECKQEKKSVLLIGHRQTLLRALSSELDLACYLDMKNVNFDLTSPFKYIAISIDSLATMLKPEKHKFDVVLIDESEQVLSHLIADTIDPAIRVRCYQKFRHYVRAAKTVVALDADLNHVTMSSLTNFGDKNPFRDKWMYLNTYKTSDREIELYESKEHLITDMHAGIERGERVFVCTNSKKLVESLTAAIKKQHGDGVSVMSITRDNSADPETMEFIKNIKTEILKYRVVLASPAMGTGIDITFPDDASEVDGVYGFFEARINAHCDIDQQLSRVRHPKRVRAWVSPQTFCFETEVEPIKYELVEHSAIPHTLRGYKFNSNPDFDFDDDYLALYANILSAQRASKNMLRQNFEALRAYNGWSICYVDKDSDGAAKGRDLLKTGKILALQARVKALCNAETLTWDDAELLQKKKDVGRPITRDNKHSLERYWIEHFYNQPINEELIVLDDEGRFQEKIRMFENILEATVTQNRSNTNHSGGVTKHGLLHELLESAGILTQTGFDTQAIISMNTLIPFVALCHERKLTIERVFNMPLRGDLDTKPMLQLSTFLDMCGMRRTKATSHKKGSNKIYEYRLDPDQLAAVMAIVDRRARGYRLAA